MYKEERLRLEKLSGILDVIAAAERKIEILLETKERCGGLPTISLGIENRIGTLEMVILRMQKRYNHIRSKI